MADERLAGGTGASAAYGPMPWAIGQTDCWPGTAKLMEECGELVQVLGKLIALGSAGVHWDGSDLRVRIEDEIADVYAAVEFFVEQNPTLDRHRMAGRQLRKVALFEQWHAERLSRRGDSVAPGGES